MENKTKDVEVMLGNPKKAILAMSIPIVVAMVVQNANNLIDSVWVAGLGPDALAAVGLIFPFFFIMMSIGNGVGVGSSAVIGRLIGQNNKSAADRAASQSILMTFVLGIVMSVLMLIFQRPLFTALGAGDAIQECIDYATPIFLFSTIFLLNAVMSNLLRSEGASKKSMYSQILAAVINIVLDPIFIYDFGLGWGMAGAAWATTVASTISLLLLVYWYFFTDITYLKIHLKGIRFEKVLDKEILRIGFPASLEMLVISLVSMVGNVIIIMVAGTNGVGVYSSTWRLVQIAMIPMMGFSSALVPVCAANYGRRRYDNIKTGFMYSLVLMEIVMIVISIITFIFADQIVTVFTYSEETAILKDDMAYGLRACCLFIPVAPLGFITSGLFQSLGMGTKSLVCTAIRNVLMLPICYALAITVGTFESFWFGTVFAEILGIIVAGVWGLYTLKALMDGRIAGPRAIE